MIVKIEIQTVKQAFPAGTAGGDWRILVHDAAGVEVSRYTGSAPVYEVDLPAGQNYRADGSRLDAAGEILGSVKSVTFDVSDTTPVEIFVADGITATQIS